MIVAVVGNGPSAYGRGAEIDEADFVVRCSWFSLAAAEDSGVKLDAWAWLGHHMYIDRLGGVPMGDYEVWCTLPLSRCNPPSDGHCGNVINAIRLAGRRAVRQTTEEDFGQQAAWLNAWPSTGMTAVDMAIRTFPQMEELRLYGFDATNKQESGWGDAREVVPWNDNSGHDFESEKRAFGELYIGKWLGEPIEFAVAWAL